MGAECLLFYKCLMLKWKMQTVHKKVRPTSMSPQVAAAWQGHFPAARAMCLNTRIIQTIQRKRRRDLSCCGRVWQRMTS